MELNFKPCYRIVFNKSLYSLQLWDELQKSYVEQFCTDEKPLAVGNFIVFRDIKASFGEQEFYRFWYYDEQRGICVFDEDILFSGWSWYEGNFLCRCLSQNERQWYVVAPKTLHRTLLGQPLGNPQHKCFISKQDESCLHYFQRGQIQTVAVDEVRTNSEGLVFYRIGNEVYGMEKYPLPDGSNNWRFSLAADGLKNW